MLDPFHGPQFRPIAIEDRAIFDAALALRPSLVSELTFTNLFAWGPEKDIRCAPWRGGILLLAKLHGHDGFLPPIGYPKCAEIYKGLYEWSRAHGVTGVANLPRASLRDLRLVPHEVTEDRAQFDYVYRTKSLATLAGRKLDGKRGFVKQFRDRYTFDYYDYDPRWYTGCRELAERWVARREAAGEVDDNVRHELNAIVRLLDHADRLAARGAVLVVDGKVVAFTFGERLNDRTFVVHFEKADSDYVGAYQVINQLFVEREALGKYMYVNREQDLGIEGIRKAKLSYQPVRLVPKYQVRFL